MRPSSGDLSDGHGHFCSWCGTAYDCTIPDVPCRNDREGTYVGGLCSKCWSDPAALALEQLEKDCRIDSFDGASPGPDAPLVVRVTHLPTGAQIEFEGRGRFRVRRNALILMRKYLADPVKAPDPSR